jgi:hypothetical protein
VNDSRKGRSGYTPVLLVAFAFGCKDEAEPCYDLQVGEQLEIEVVEHYDQSSRFTGALPDQQGNFCPTDLDLVGGDVVQIHVERQAFSEVTNCRSSLFVVENPEELGWQEVGTGNSNVAPIPFLFGRFPAVVGGCAAGVSLAIDNKRPTTDLLAVSEPGQDPFFYLRREVVGSDACGLPSCSDEFVVSIREPP